jgi:uncharacterized protein YecT (DUF1311 family)
MPTDRVGDPWPETTYNGFSEPPPPPPRRPRRLPPVSGRNLALGAGAAIAAGLLLGLWAKPDFGKDPGAAAERAAPPVPIEVGKPPPPEPLRSAGKLEVLSPDQATSGLAASAPPPAAYLPGPPPPLPQVARTPSYAAARPQPLAVDPPRADPPRPAPMADPAAGRAGFDCSAARSAAEAMVCADPELAAADRELTRAYRRALQSGAPPGAIRADQRDWLNIREDAARHSRRALASVYQQRIDELNATADGPDDGPG